jgi:YfiH family protein
VSRPPTSAAGFIEHPLLSAAGVEHGFGTRQARAPSAVIRPRQVHGVAVAQVGPEGELDREEADAVISNRPGSAVGIVTADCVPILVASASGHAVAAVHAGWRGLAAGVVEAGLAALRARGHPAEEIVAVIGPRIGHCCYEVDAPVMDPLRARFGPGLEEASRLSRPEHWWLDLGRLVALDLLRMGVASDRLGILTDACTACGAGRFDSYRRDGPAAGRLLHYIRPGSQFGSNAGPTG